MFSFFGLVSLVFLTVSFVFSVVVFLKFLKSPFSVPLLFLSLFFAFFVAFLVFDFAGFSQTAFLLELVSFFCLFLTCFGLFRVFARRI